MAAMLFADIKKVALLKSESRAEKTQDIVEWDLNTRGQHERLKPFVFEMQDCTRADGEKVRLEIAQTSTALNEPGVPESGTGSALWTAAIGLAKYLEYRYRVPAVAPRGDLVGKRVLELGCGTGLVSLTAAALGADVVATDIPECLAAVTAPNLAANRGGLWGSVEERALVWGVTPLVPGFAPSVPSAEAALAPPAAGGGGGDWFDLVVASDVIYRAEHVPLLLETLRGTVGPGRTALVAFDRRGREGVGAFLRALGRRENPPATEACGGQVAAVGIDDGACAGDGREVVAGKAEVHFELREISNETDMPPGYRFSHFGLVELYRIA